MKPVIGKKYKLHIKESDLLDEYKGTGTCMCQECSWLWLFKDLTPFDGNVFKAGSFLESEIIKEIK